MAENGKYKLIEEDLNSVSVGHDAGEKKNPHVVELLYAPKNFGTLVQHFFGSEKDKNKGKSGT